MLKQKMGPRVEVDALPGNEAAQRALVGQKERVVLRVRRDEVEPDPNQPRKVFKREQVDNRRQSIEHEKQIQPIEVRPKGANGKYRIIDGEVRWLAMTGFEFVDIIVNDDPLTELQIFERQIAANVERGSFVLADICRSIVRLKDEFGMSHKYLADNNFREFARGREDWVGERYRVWKKVSGDWKDFEALPELVKAMEDYEDVFTHVQFVASAPEPLRKRLSRMVTDGLTVADLKKFVDANTTPKVAPATESGPGHRVPPTSRSLRVGVPSTPPPAAKPQREPRESQEHVESLGWDFAPTPDAWTSSTVAAQTTAAKSVLDSIAAHAQEVKDDKNFSPIARAAIVKQLRDVLQAGMQALSLFEE